MNQHFTVKELPESEKPYEKCLRFGAEYLSDAELLAVIIRTGTAGKKSIDVAQEILSRNEKSLLNLYYLSVKELVSIPGIGKVKAVQLKCLAEINILQPARYGHRFLLPNPISPLMLLSCKETSDYRHHLPQLNSNCNNTKNGAPSTA